MAAITRVLSGKTRGEENAPTFWAPNRGQSQETTVASPLAVPPFRGQKVVSVLVVFIFLFVGHFPRAVDL